MRNIFIYFTLIFSSLLYGCSSVYNTSIQLPAEPLKAKEVQVCGELGMLPEAVPAKSGKHSIFSGGVLLRYAPTDDFFLDGRLYTTLNGALDLTSEPSGAGAGINFILNDINSDYVYGLRLSYERAWTFWDDGDGFGLQLFSWLPSFYSIRPYAAIGSAFAISDDGFVGFGVFGNIGLSYELMEKVNLNIELSPIMQVNTHNHITHGVYTASAGISLVI